MNRRLLHPCGKHLEVNPNVRIYRTDDPEGFVFDEINKGHAAEIEIALQTRAPIRRERLGFLQQPADIAEAPDLKDLLYDIEAHFMKQGGPKELLDRVRTTRQRLR